MDNDFDREVAILLLVEAMRNLSAHQCEHIIGWAGEVDENGVCANGIHIVDNVRTMLAEGQ